jgi:hypothetical protein
MRHSGSDCGTRDPVGENRGTLPNDSPEQLSIDCKLPNHLGNGLPLNRGVVPDVRPRRLNYRFAVKNLACLGESEAASSKDTPVGSNGSMARPKPEAPALPMLAAVKSPVESCRAMAFAFRRASAGPVKPGNRRLGAEVSRSSMLVMCRMAQ